MELEKGIFIVKIVTKFHKAVLKTAEIQHCKKWHNFMNKGQRLSKASGDMDLLFQEGSGLKARKLLQNFLGL